MCIICSDQRCFHSVTQEPEKDQGSVIYYPVRHGKRGAVPYVISVFATEPGLFRRSRVDTYEHILEFFENRIRLEHSLLLAVEARQRLRERFDV